MKYLAFMILCLAGCSRGKVTQSFEVLVKSQGMGVVSSAQISIDKRPVGVSNGQGIWRGRLEFERDSSHKITIEVEKEGYYFSPWESGFVASGEPIKKAADLFSVPKLSAAKVTKERADGLEDADDGASNKSDEASEDPVVIWRKNYKKYIASLPPLMPWSDAYKNMNSFEEEQAPKPTKDASESSLQLSTFYIHSQNLPQEGSKFWIGLKEPKNVCSTNSRGRCSLELSPQTTQLLATHEGYKSQITRPRGQGTHYLKLERGFSRDLFVSSRDEAWKLTSKGIEVVRGIGTSFVVLDQDTEDLYLECVERCSSKPQKVSFALQGITTIKPHFSKDLMPLKVEKIHFAGDFEGPLDLAYSEVISSIPLALKKYGFREPYSDETEVPSVALTLVRNLGADQNNTASDLSLEILFLDAKADITGASLTSCADRMAPCLMQTWERAYLSSRNLGPEAIKSEKPSSETSVHLVKLDGKPLIGARLYRDGVYLGKSRENGKMTVPSLASKTLEVVAPGYRFYRNYLSSPEVSLKISLAPSSSLVISQNPEPSASIYQDGLRVGKLPGVVAVKSTRMELDPGEKLKKVNFVLNPGESLDLSKLVFYPDLLGRWKAQLLARDFEGAEKTLESVSKNHPDWAPLAYLRSEKLFVEQGLISADLDSLGNYPTARWFKVKALALQTIEAGKSPDDFKSLDSSLADILLVSGEGPSYDFFSELHYLRSLGELKRSMIVKDALGSDLALRKVNEWFELGYGSQYQSLGRRMWTLAREQSITNKKGM